MSEFSNAVTRLIDVHGSASALVKISGLGDSVISRLASAEIRPRIETVQKLCVALTDPEASELLLAYLRDTIPAGCHHLVSLQSGAPSRLAEDPIDYGGNHALNRLRTSVREAILHLAEMSMEDSEFSIWLEKHVQYLDPQWADERINKILRSRPA